METDEDKCRCGLPRGFHQSSGPWMMNPAAAIANCIGFVNADPELARQEANARDAAERARMTLEAELCWAKWGIQQSTGAAALAGQPGFIAGYLAAKGITE